MKTVLVFCEGYHDVVFAQRSLGTHAGCEWVDKPVGELPSPFGTTGRVARKGLIARRFERQAVDDLRLRNAAHPPLPCFESIVENTAADTMFFLVRAHGQERHAPVRSERGTRCLPDGNALERRLTGRGGATSHRGTPAS